MVPATEKDTLLGLMEIWSSPAAFSAVQKTPEYDTFNSTVAKQELFDAKQDMKVSEWTPAAGFVARGVEKDSPRASIVMLAKFVVKENDVKGNREGLVDVLR